MPLSIIEPPMPKTNLDNNSLVKYKNAIRNMHYRNILQKTQTGNPGFISFLDALFNLYLRNVVDYKLLTPNAFDHIRQGKFGSVFFWFYFRASIMNPYFVYSINETILKGSRVFTPTLGWSSYAYGFGESKKTQEYVGVDVIPDVCQKTAEFMEQYPHIKTRIICQPSEELARDKSFLTKYKGHFDVVFFSPPYYELELYPGKNQSTTVYKTYRDWLEGYWLATIRLCYHVLIPGGKMCYVLSASGGKNENNIMEDMNEITNTVFKLSRTVGMFNKNMYIPTGSNRESSEKIMIFTK